MMEELNTLYAQQKNIRTLDKTSSDKKVLSILKEKYLSKYGYSRLDNSTKRKISLDKAMKNEGELEVLRYIVVLREYMKNEPDTFQKLDKDIKYIQKHRKKKLDVHP